MANEVLSAYENGDIASLIKSLEQSALSASDTGDVERFERKYQQLRSLYTSSSSSSPSSRDSPAGNENVLTALHLLMLLSESNISQYHSELESLSRATLDSPEIQWVDRVEQGIMEGSYQEVRQLLSRPPGQAFSRWGTLITESIRAKIAECSASAYESLPLVNLTTLLLLQNVKETERYAGERGWLVKDGRVVFPKHENVVMGTEMQVDGEPHNTAAGARENLISQTLGYARELESIV